MPAPLIDNDLTLQNSGPNIVDENLNNIPQIENASDIDNARINTVQNGAQQIANEIQQSQEVQEELIEDLQKTRDEQLEAGEEVLDAQLEAQQRNEELVQQQLNQQIETQEQINLQQANFLESQTQLQQQQLTDFSNIREQEKALEIKEREKGIRVERAKSEALGHMLGMSFSSGMKRYVAGQVEGLNDALENFTLQYDSQTLDTENTLRQNILDTNYRALEITTENNQTLNNLRNQYIASLRNIENGIGLNTAEKAQLKADVNAAFRQGKTTVEDNVRTNMNNLRREAIQTQESFVGTLETRRENSLARFQSLVATGQAYRLSSAELNQISSETGISPTELIGRRNAATRAGLNQAIVAGGANLSAGEINQIHTEYDAYLTQGMSPSDAVTLLSKRFTKIDLSSLLNESKAQLQLDVINAKTPEARAAALARIDALDPNNSTISPQQQLQDQVATLELALLNTEDEPTKAIIRARLNSLKTDGTSSGLFDSILSTPTEADVTAGRDITIAGSTKALVTGLPTNAKNLLSAADGTIIPTRLKGQLSPGNPGGKECGEYVNDITGGAANGFPRLGNSYQSKLDAAPNSTGGVGNVAVWQPGGGFQEFGHAGIIVGEDGDNWLIKNSNFVPGTVTTEKIAKSKITGYSEASVFKTGEVSTVPANPDGTPISAADDTSVNFGASNNNSTASIPSISKSSSNNRIIEGAKSAALNPISPKVQAIIGGLGQISDYISDIKN